ncbi:MAG: hypothetical protein SAJ37_22015, partial [Oscillatoria sp. PMC 1068.18]|nr:hypothetical protein [Oscillatoria sp. PMC 1068.18]
IEQVSRKLTKCILSNNENDNLSPFERANRDFEYIKKIQEKIIEIDIVVRRRSPDCHPGNREIWPQCQDQFAQYGEKSREILIEIVPIFLAEKKSAKEKFDMTIEYLEAIKQKPSLIIPLLETSSETSHSQDRLE